MAVILKGIRNCSAESLSWEMIDTAGGSEVRVPDSFFAVAAELAEPVDRGIRPCGRLGQVDMGPQGQRDASTPAGSVRHSICPTGRKAKQAILKTHRRQCVIPSSSTGGRSGQETIGKAGPVRRDIGPDPGPQCHWPSKAGNIDGPYGLILRPRHGIRQWIDHAGAERTVPGKRRSYRPPVGRTPAFDGQLECRTRDSPNWWRALEQSMTPPTVTHHSQRQPLHHRCR